MRTMHLLEIAAAALAAAACADSPTKPAEVTATPTTLRAAAQDSAGLAWRSDSMTKMTYVSWNEGDLQHYLSFSTGMVNGLPTALVGYGVLTSQPCWWDPTQTCYESLSWGWGAVPVKDVHGGVGAMTVATNTAPDANPGFMHYNDPGGEIRVTVRQVPGSGSTYHDVGTFTWGAMTTTYNVLTQFKGGTAEGEVVGAVIPTGATATLMQSFGHTITVLRP